MNALLKCLIKQQESRYRLNHQPEVKVSTYIPLNKTTSMLTNSQTRPCFSQTSQTFPIIQSQRRTLLRLHIIPINREVEDARERRVYRDVVLSKSTYAASSARARNKSLDRKLISLGVRIYLRRLRRALLLYQM